MATFFRAVKLPFASSKLLLGVEKKTGGLLWEVVEVGVGGKALVRYSGRLPTAASSVFAGTNQMRFLSTEVDCWTKQVNSSGVNRMYPPKYGGYQEVTFPNYEDLMRDSKKDTTKHARDSEDQRRIYSGLFTLWAGIFTLYSAKQIARTVVAYKGITKDLLAMANTEIDVSSIPEGKSKTFMWRRKPIFVRHRSMEDIERENAVPMSELRDPEHDDVRAPQNKKWVVVIGVCTHLGCIPVAGAGAFNGYYCPCHGSHYDSGGRIRRGPAPLNLEIPPYTFKDENTILIGEE